MCMLKKPKLIEMGVHVDDRGILSYLNHFPVVDDEVTGYKFDKIYFTQNFSTDTIRAWHGHKYAEKFCMVVSGSILVCLVEHKDSYEQLGIFSPDYRYVLSARKPFALFIPSGYYNGFKALENNTRVVWGTNYLVTDSKLIEEDDMRLPIKPVSDPCFFGSQNFSHMTMWEVENR